MRVQPKVPTYEVFHLQDRSQFRALRDWLEERGWRMQIQDWEETGFLRPDSYIDTNFFDVFFNIDQYILVDTVQNNWHFYSLRTAPNLDSFEII